MANLSDRIVSMSAAVGLLFLLLAVAQAAALEPRASTTTQHTSATSTSTSITTHTVTAGKDATFVFNPDSLTANVGDIIEFAFYPLNHSVARSAYKTPCLPIDVSNPRWGDGFWSGFFPLTTGTEQVPKYRVRINDTQPVWFYCSAPGACIDDGMIGVINPNSTQTLATQAEFARNSTIMLSPGESVPAEGADPTTTATSSADTTTHSSGLSKGAIAGIVVGSVAFVTVAGLAIWLMGRNHTLSSILRYSQPPPPRTSNIPPIPYSPPAATSPYSPEFEPKMSHMASPEMSWQPAGYIPRAMSPETQSVGDVHEGQGLMASNAFHNQYVDGQPPKAVRIQSSPGETPWSPGAFGLGQQYAPAPPSEMGGEGISPGHTGAGVAGSTHGSYMGQHPDGPHELDARSAMPNSPGGPPEYLENPDHIQSSNRRAFSFNEGSEAPTGVEKVLRD